MNIPFSKIDCSGNELSYVKRVLDCGWLTTAGVALEFERRFASIVGAKYACVVNSCTAALHLGLEALGVGPGDKVLAPSMTFTSSCEIARYLGADPVLADCDYGTRLLTPEIIERELDRHPDIKAVIVVHFGGQAAQMTGSGGEKGIVDICRERGVKVLEDAAHAFPSRLNGAMVGSFGDVTCFSFYANKTITTGEGGMVCTDDESIYRRVKTMRLHGINRDIWDRFTSKSASWEYDVIAPGFKYNMPDVNAAIGLAQLERAEDFRRQRQRCCEYYLDRLDGLAEIDLPVSKCAPEEHSWHLFPIVVRPEAAVDRDKLVELMAEAGIGLSVHYKPLHRMTYYRDHYHLCPEQFPVSEALWKGTVSLPVYPGLLNSELEYICRCLRRFVTGSSIL